MGLEASHKVPDGKMVKIEMKQDEDTIFDVKVHGDFFIEPPEKLEDLSDRMEGLSVDSSKEDVMDSLEGLQADLIGFSAEDVAEAFRKAVEGDRDE